MYSLNVCINYYINELVLSNHAKSTMEAYKGDLDQFKKFIKNKYSGIRDIEQIKVKHIAEFRRYLSVEKQFCEKTIKRKIDCLRAFFGYLYEYGYIDANPTVKLIKNKIKKEELPKYLNYKEISQIIAAAKSNKNENLIRDTALLYCFAYTGARRSEILQLNWSNVNFFDSTLAIHREKNGTSDILPLQDGLKKALKDLYIQSRPDPDDPVFISKKGNRLSNTAFNEMLRKSVKLSGLKKDFNITSHIFRHSFITELMKQGVTLREIQQYTGHKDINSLMGYTHICSEYKKRVIETLPQISV